MSEWKFWDWIAYSGIFAAALILACDTALKGAPNVALKLPVWISSPYWSFAPLCLMFLSSAILAIKIFRAKITPHGNKLQTVSPNYSGAHTAAILPKAEEKRVYIEQTVDF